MYVCDWTDLSPQGGTGEVLCEDVQAAQQRRKAILVHPHSVQLLLSHLLHNSTRETLHTQCGLERPALVPCVHLENLIVFQNQYLLLWVLHALNIPEIYTYK